MDRPGRLVNNALGTAVVVGIVGGVYATLAAVLGGALYGVLRMGAWLFCH